MDDIAHNPVALVFYVLVFGLIGVALGARKGRPFAGFVFGVLLGPIGWLIVAVGPDVKATEQATLMRKCPHCAELVQPGAKVCKHCRRDIAPTPTLAANYFYDQEHELPKPTLSSSKEKFYYYANGEQQGPVDASDLKLMWQDGLITNDTPVILEGESQWRNVRDYLALLSK